MRLWPIVSANPRCKAVLVRGAADAKARLDKLQGAIIAMFNDINRMFEVNTQFEFSNHITYSVTKFLARFDAIFSLNQDSLLELRYREAMQLADPQPRYRRHRRQSPAEMDARSQPVQRRAENAALFQAARLGRLGDGR